MDRHVARRLLLLLRLEGEPAVVALADAQVDHRVEPGPGQGRHPHDVEHGPALGRVAHEQALHLRVRERPLLLVVRDLVLGDRQVMERVPLGEAPLRQPRPVELEPPEILRVGSPREPGVGGHLVHVPERDGPGHVLDEGLDRRVPGRQPVQENPERPRLVELRPVRDLERPHERLVVVGDRRAPTDDLPVLLRLGQGLLRGDADLVRAELGVPHRLVGRPLAEDLVDALVHALAEEVLHVLVRVLQHAPDLQGLGEEAVLLASARRPGILDPALELGDDLRGASPRDEQGLRVQPLDEALAELVLELPGDRHRHAVVPLILGEVAHACVGSAGHWMDVLGRGFVPQSYRYLEPRFRAIAGACLS